MKKAKPVIVKMGGIETEYPSGNKAAQALGIDQAKLSKMARLGVEEQGISVRFKDCKDVGGSNDGVA